MKKRSLTTWLALASVLVLTLTMIWQLNRVDEEILLKRSSMRASSAGVPSDVQQAPTAGNVSSSFKEKVATLENYIRTNPSDTTHILMLARFYHDAHQPDKAIPLYKNVLAIEPASASVWLDLINSFGMAQKWVDAENSAKEMLTHFPNHSEALYNLGAIYANQGKFPLAKSVWTELVQQAPPESHVAHLANSGLQQLATK